MTGSYITKVHTERAGIYIQTIMVSRAFRVTSRTYSIVVRILVHVYSTCRLSFMGWCTGL